MMGFLSRKKTKKVKAEKAQEEENTEQVKGPSAQEAKEHPEESAHNEGSHHQSSTNATQNASSHTPAPGTPVLDRSDEAFIEEILSGKGQTPSVPDGVTVPELDWPSDDASSVNRAEPSEEGSGDKQKGKNKESDSQEDTKDGGKKKKTNRFSLLFSKRKSKHGDHLKPESAAVADSEEAEEQKEAVDINRVLDRLNLGAKNNKVINLSNESTELLTKFTQVFKDLANGVPTAYDDLVSLISDRDGTITKCFEKLPSGLQKLVTQLPEKLTQSIAPEVLAAAAKSQGIEAAAEGGMKELTQKLLMPQNLMELVTKPGALVAMLKAIVQALQSRWPAFIGLNVIWSVALFSTFPLSKIVYYKNNSANHTMEFSTHVCSLVLSQTWT